MNRTARLTQNCANLLSCAITCRCLATTAEMSGLTQRNSTNYFLQTAYGSKSILPTCPVSNTGKVWAQRSKQKLLL